MCSSSRGNGRTGVSVFCVGLVHIKKHMACRNAVKILANAEIEAQCSLRLQCLLARDGQAESSGDGMDDVLEMIVIIDGRQQRGTSEKSGLGFTEGHIDVVDAVLFEETEDVLRGLERDVAGGAVLLDSNPNSDGTGNIFCAALPTRLLPTKADEVDGGDQDLSLVEDLANLRTNVSPQNATLLEDHEPRYELWPTGHPGPVGRDHQLEEAVYGEARSLAR